MIFDQGRRGDPLIAPGPHDGILKYFQVLFEIPVPDSLSVTCLRVSKVNRLKQKRDACGGDGKPSYVRIRIRFFRAPSECAPRRTPHTDGAGSRSRSTADR